VNPLSTALGVVVLLLGGALWWQYDARESVQSEYDSYKAAQAQAVKDQTEKAATDKKEQDKRQGEAERQHAQDQKDNQGLLGRLNAAAARVRQLQVTVHGSTLHPSVADQGGVQGGLSGASEGGGTDAALNAVFGAASDLAAACLSTDSDRTAIIALEPK